MTTSRHSQGLALLVLALFLLSGLSSLVYQVVWVRMLTTVIGGSNLTVSIVLAVFMAGLGIGCHLVARRIDRVHNPDSLVVFYGVLELFIGIFGLAMPLLLHLATPLQAWVYRSFFLQPYAYNFVTLFACAAIFIIPTTLMGATFPVLCRYYVLTLDHVGTRVGRLYMVNTAGAALGALLAGFWLIPALGVRGALWTAVVINVIIAAASVSIFSGGHSWRQLASLAAPAAPSTTAWRATGAVGILAIFTVSGFCSMAYEVIWTRLLGLLVGPTTFSFTLVLFTFISGLGLGSMIFGWLGDRTRRPFALLIATQLGAAVLALGISQLLGTSQLFFAKLLASQQENFALQQALKAGVIFLLMLPATLCLGAAFPLVGKLYTTSLATVGRSVGAAYALNTAGSVLGAICAGFLLIPALGKEHAIASLVLLQAAVAAIVFYRANRRRPARRVAVVAVVAVLVLLGSRYPQWTRVLLADGKFHRFDELRVDMDDVGFVEALLRGDRLLAEAFETNELLYYGDGVGGFTTVIAHESPLGIRRLVLVNNGKPDASSHGDLGSQVLLGQVPLLFHPAAKTVMVLGLASGITAGEILHYPVDALDILEFSPEVVEACALFNDWNNGVLSDPRTRLIMQDARTHLAYTDTRYDVVISEPSNPWMAGMANVFTVEFFRSVEAHMNPGGIFVQWLHSYQLDWDTFAMIGRTFTSVFPNGVLLRSAQDSDYLLIGLVDGTRLDAEVGRANMVHATKSTNLQLADPALVLSLVVNERLGRLFGDGLVHTDDRPHLEYSAPRQLYASGSDIPPRIMQGSELSSETMRQLSVLKAPERQIDRAEFLGSLNAAPFGLVDYEILKDDATRERYRRVLEKYCRENVIAHHATIAAAPERALAQHVQRQAMERNLQRLLATGAPDAVLAATYFSLGHVLSSMKEFQRAAACFSAAYVLRPSKDEALFNLGLCHEKLGNYTEALALFQRLHADSPTSVKILGRMAANHLRLNHAAIAADLFDRILGIDNRDAAALLGLGAIHGARGEYASALEYSLRAIDVAPGAAKAYQNAAAALMNLNRAAEAAVYAREGLRVDPQNAILQQIVKDGESGRPLDAPPAPANNRP